MHENKIVELTGSKFKEYKYSVIPVTMETSSFALYLNGMVVAMSNMIVYLSFKEVELGLIWTMFTFLFIDY